MRRTNGESETVRSIALQRGVRRLRGALVMAGMVLLCTLAGASAAAAQDNTATVTDVANPDGYSCSQAGYVDFESLPDGTSLPGTIAGLDFVTTAGHSWLVGDFATGHYNGKYPNGKYTSQGTHWAWLGENQGSGRINVSSGAASYFSLLAGVGSSGVYLEAFDASDKLLAVAGPAPYNIESGHMTELKITRAQADIAYVLVHDTGNFFLVDSICTDAANVNEPRPGPPTIDKVTPFNGGGQVSWQPPTDNGGGAISQYEVTAAPYANTDHFAPSAHAVTQKVPASTSSASFYGLIEDCHQEYVFTVRAIGTVGIGPAVASSAVKTSGYVGGAPPPFVQPAPPMVEIVIDGESGKMDGTYPSFNPLQVRSYCPESTQSPPTATDFSAFPLLSDPTMVNWSVGQAPQYPSGGGTLPSHHYLTDAVAALGGVVLPYSYSGAQMLPTGDFSFTPYTSDLSSHQSLNKDTHNLAVEISSIHAAWPRTRIIVVGHSWGGVIAEQYWKDNTEKALAKLRVSRVFSLDAPINGTATAWECHVLHISSLCAAIAGFGGGNIGSQLINEMGRRWENLQAMDTEIVNQDKKSFVYVDIGTHGDPAYANFSTNGVFDSFIPQLVMETCDPTGSPGGTCSAAHPPSIATNCPTEGNNVWEPFGHFAVKLCPDTAELIKQAVEAAAKG
jgi:Fibronectin type III domain